MTSKEKPRRVRSILVPVDGSESSRRAVQLAAEMAHAFAAELTLLHVSPVKELPVLMVEAEDPREANEAELLLGGEAQLARKLGVESAVVLRHGRTADQILRQIAASRPDLVIMGTRGLTGARSVLLGSVSRVISRRSQAQVVLVR
jgi:nucleotide-binding universal stress UspA family protein